MKLKHPENMKSFGCVFANPLLFYRPDNNFLHFLNGWEKKSLKFSNLPDQFNVLHFKHSTMVMAGKLYFFNN